MKKIAKKVQKLNEYIAARATIVMSTMWCVYAFFVWSVLPVAVPQLQTFVFYVSGGIVQLVALPLIMVGQNVLNRNSERRAIQDHKMLMVEMKELRELHAELHALVQSLTNKG